MDINKTDAMPMQSKDQHHEWIQSAIKHQGSLIAYAKKHNRVKKDGTIDEGWLADLAGGNDIWAKRARLAITLKEMHQGKEKMMNDMHSGQNDMLAEEV